MERALGSQRLFWNWILCRTKRIEKITGRRQGLSGWMWLQCQRHVVYRKTTQQNGFEPLREQENGISVFFRYQVRSTTSLGKQVVIECSQLIQKVSIPYPKDMFPNSNDMKPMSFCYLDIISVIAELLIDACKSSR